MGTNFFRGNRWIRNLKSNIDIPELWELEFSRKHYIPWKNTTPFVSKLSEDFKKFFFSICDVI